MHVCTHTHTCPGYGQDAHAVLDQGAEPKVSTANLDHKALKKETLDSRTSFLRLVTNGDGQLDGCRLRRMAKASCSGKGSSSGAGAKPSVVGRDRCLIELMAAHDAVASPNRGLVERE